MGKILIALLLVAVWCSGAAAAVSLEPASGYVHLPDAQVASRGAIEAFAAYVTAEGTNELGRAMTMGFPCHGNGFTIGAVGGIGQNVELGVAYTSISKSIGDANAFAVAAKWQFYSNAASGLAAAVGGSWRNWNADMDRETAIDVIHLDLPTVTSAYLALDKTWRPASASICSVSGTVGVAWDNFGDTQQTSDSGSPFGGTDVPISPTGVVASDSFVSPFIGIRVDAPKWSVLGEFRPALECGGFDYQSVLWSFAVRGQVAPSTALTMGVSTWNLPYSDSDPAFFLEVSHCFGK